MYNIHVLLKCIIHKNIIFLDLYHILNEEKIKIIDF